MESGDAYLTAVQATHPHRPTRPNPPANFTTTDVFYPANGTARVTSLQQLTPTSETLLSRGRRATAQAEVVYQTTYPVTYSIVKGALFRPALSVALGRAVLVS